MGNMQAIGVLSYSTDTGDSVNVTIFSTTLVLFKFVSMVTATTLQPSFYFV